VLKLPGETAVASINMAVDGFVKNGIATPHDVVIAEQLAKVLSGNGVDMNDELSEEYILGLERDALVNLSKTRQTKARISHLLFKGKPLRN
jgi:3-hydroxyacyl-CoA dehydrogenase